MVTIGENGISEKDILVHDAETEDNTLHNMLVKLRYPLVTGIIRSYGDTTLEEREMGLMEMVKANAKFEKTADLFYSGDTYEVK